MAENTVKEEKVEEKVEETTNSDAEKYRKLRKRVFVAGRIALGLGLATGAGLVAYKMGKSTGKYDCLADIYKNFPDVREAIKVIDPAFFTTLS